MVAHDKEREEGRQLLSVVIGERMKRQLAAVAAENERSLSQETRLALRRHLAGRDYHLRGDDAG
jgi:hypothetical protein